MTEIKHYVKNRFSIDFWIAALLFIICFVWKAFYLNARDLCLDEPYTLFHAQQGLKHVVELSFSKEPTPPLFMALVWLVNVGADLSTPILRLLPLTFNSLTIVFLYKAGRLLEGRYTGLLASLLFLLSSTHFYFGLELRTYSLASLATVLSIYGFLRLIQKPGWRSVFILSAGQLLFLYCNYFGWMLVGVLYGLGILLYLKNRSIILDLSKALVITILGFSPFFIVLYTRFMTASGGTWIAPPLSDYYINFIGYFVNDKAVLLLCFALVLVALIIRLVLRYKFNTADRSHWKKALIMALIFLIPYSFMFFVSFKIPMFIDRYILFNSIPLYLGLALIIRLSSLKSVPLFGTLSFVLVLGAMYQEMNILPESYYYRELAKADQCINTDEKAAIIVYPKWSELAFSYHHDKELFKSHSDLAEKLKENDIYPVWGFDDFNGKKNNIANKRIYLYADGNSGTSDYKRINSYLNKNYNKVDSQFFKACIYVTTYEKKEE